MINKLCNDIEFIEEELMPHGIYKDYEIIGSARLNSEGNPVILIKSPTDKKQQIFISRMVMEMKIGRNLNQNELILFKDNNKLNVKLENMEVGIRESRIDTTVEHHKCPICGKEFDISGKKLISVRTKRKRYGNAYTGPYCSQICARKFNRNNAFGKGVII